METSCMSLITLTLLPYFFRATWKPERINTNSPNNTTATTTTYNNNNNDNDNNLNNTVSDLQSAAGCLTLMKVKTKTLFLCIIHCTE